LHLARVREGENKDDRSCGRWDYFRIRSFADTNAKELQVLLNHQTMELFRGIGVISFCVYTEPSPTSIMPVLQRLFEKGKHEVLDLSGFSLTRGGSSNLQKLVGCNVVRELTLMYLRGGGDHLSMRTILRGFETLSEACAHRNEIIKLETLKVSFCNFRVTNCCKQRRLVPIVRAIASAIGKLSTLKELSLSFNAALDESTAYALANNVIAVPSCGIEELKLDWVDPNDENEDESYESDSSNELEDYGQDEDSDDLAEDNKGNKQDDYNQDDLLEDSEDNKQDEDYNQDDLLEDSEDNKQDEDYDQDDL
jgi:DNA-binding PadR family transcriptional regulator